jgi:hypothetical protein
VNCCAARCKSVGPSDGINRRQSGRATLSSSCASRRYQLRAVVAAIWFAEVDLDFGVSDPVAVAAGIEEIVGAQEDTDVHLLASLLRLAARGYHVAKRNDDKYRCQAQAAEAMAAEAERIFAGQGSAMLAASMMSDAVAQLHGIPAAKDRRTQLRHRLVDIQARIPEEMSVFSYPLDTNGVEAEVREALGEGSLVDNLFKFAAVANSPQPAVLVAEAQESMRRHPLSSLLAAVHFDREGKAVHRTAASALADDPADAAILRQIAQSESIRRNVIGTTIEIARCTIAARHFVAENALAVMLQQSPFVPRELVATFSRGFVRFFQGNFVSAVYILTPLLESSLRHVLKMNGNDVTIFDDATQTQKDRTISSLFEQMRDELDAAFTKPITTDIENVFLNLPGPHLRHDFAHGLAHDGMNEISRQAPDRLRAISLNFQLRLFRRRSSS